MKHIALLVSTLLVFGSAQAQFATELKSQEVVPGITMIEGADGFGGGNMALLTGDERTVLIDDGLEPLSQALIEMATEIAGKPIDFVINTHVHGDHTGGNAALAGQGATVVAHDNIRKRMVADPEVPAAALPVVTYSDAVTFHLNSMTAVVFHVEHAHTDGDGIIHFPDQNVIHSGDTMFNYLFPFIDLDNGGSVMGYIAAQKKMIAMSDETTLIIPGHGPVASREDLEINLKVLVDGRTKVKALVDKGMSAEEVVAENPLAEYHDTYNWGFITTEKMTLTHYRDLTE